MLAEFLAEHPLEGLLCAREAVTPPRCGDPAWQRLAPEGAAELHSLWARFEALPYPMRTATGFLAFSRDGSRQADERAYFERRRKLCVSALAFCCGEDALDAVVDGLWCVLEESSWVISAHNINPIPGAPSPSEYPLPDVERPYIDLFSAQTGMILSLVERMAREQLDAVSPVICRRIDAEIQRRILTPFMATDDFWWMGVRRTDLNNWTPWILSNLMLTACLSPLDTPALAALLTRACRMLDRYLAVLPADGGCDEGAGYWNMAGGSLLDCLELLERVTAGRMTFWADEKIRNILSFPLKAEIGGGWFVNFADCDARPFLSGERIQLAGERLRDPALAAMGSRLRGTVWDQLADTPHLTRALGLLFHPAGPAGEVLSPADVWLPDLQLRLVRRGGFTLCCKGGHNGESHNHNDVGSFMLYLNGEPQLVDAGNMVYTARTFSSERYTLWNIRSLWHNVPLVNGCEQAPGPDHRARDVECLPDGLSLDLAGAYPAGAGVSRLRRTLRLTETGLRLTDEIHLSKPGNVAWTLLLRHEPRLCGREVRAGGIRFTLPEGFAAAWEEKPVDDPRMARSYPGSLYRLELTSDKPSDRLELCFGEW